MGWLFRIVPVKCNSRKLMHSVYDRRKIIRLASTEVASKRNPLQWESVVGLEIHAQILANSKIFSSAGTRYMAMTNQQVSLFDAGIPGTLPVLNRRCVEAAVLTAFALNCKVHKVSTFDRKHYFYADLPCGYQITQQRHPIATDGRIDFAVYNSSFHKSAYKRRVRVMQIQLEQDSGKSLHDVYSKYSLIDLNRAGIGLMEIVLAPDLRDGEEAAALVKELIAILTSIGTCNCKMEEGSLRVDANISVNKPGEEFGVRAEVKNISSVRGVANAIEYEIKRQISLKESGESVVNETRSYDIQSKKTVSMRDKEVVQDYRFMPEPNLPPLRLADDTDKLTNVDDQINVDKLKRSLCLLPDEMRLIMVDKYGIKLENTIFFANEPKLFRHLDSILKDGTRPTKRVVNFLLIELLASLNEKDIPVGECELETVHLMEVIDMMLEEEINNLTAKKILCMLLEGDKRTPVKIVDEENLSLIRDADSLSALCDQVIASNPKMVDEYKAGRKKLLQVLVEMVKVKSNSRAHMKMVVRIITDKLRNNGPS